MKYVHDTEYERDRVFTQEELATINPANLMRFFYHRTYGDPNPQLDDNLEPLVRANTLKFWKKAISFFMPNNLMAWNQLANTGNPTRCRELNDLIADVKKAEVRKKGITSQARRPITAAEFCELATFCKNPANGILMRYALPKK